MPIETLPGIPINAELCLAAVEKNVERGIGAGVARGNLYRLAKERGGVGTAPLLAELNGAPIGIQVLVLAGGDQPGAAVLPGGEVNRVIVDELRDAVKLARDPVVW